MRAGFKEGMEEEYTLIHLDRSEFWCLVSKRDDFRETRNSHRLHSQHLSWTHTNGTECHEPFVEVLGQSVHAATKLFSLESGCRPGPSPYIRILGCREIFDGCTREDLSSEIPWEHHILGRRKSSLPSTWRRDQRLDTKGDGKRTECQQGQISAENSSHFQGTPQHPWTPHLPEDSSVQVPAEYLSTEVPQVPSSTLHQNWMGGLHSPPPPAHNAPCVFSLEEWRKHQCQSLDTVHSPSLSPSSRPASVPAEPPNNVLKLFLLFRIPPVYCCPVCWPTVIASQLFSLYFLLPLSDPASHWHPIISKMKIQGWLPTSLTHCGSITHRTRLQPHWPGRQGPSYLLQPLQPHLLTVLLCI